MYLYPHTGQLKALERKLHVKLDAACGQLESLGSALADVARVEGPQGNKLFGGEWALVRKVVCACG